MSRQEPIEQSWMPRTKLGLLVQEGKIATLGEIFESGFKIREAEIVRSPFSCAFIICADIFLLLIRGAINSMSPLIRVFLRA